MKHAKPRRRRLLMVRIGAVAVAGLAVSLLSGSTAPATASVGHAQINGSGSTWAANAVNQWIADVTNNGLQVVFTSSGSASGRQDYAYGTTDFSVSDIGYRGKDPVTGSVDSSSRPYAYVPIVAGGTSFPYQIRVGGQLVRNLRLSGETLAKIFTNQITNWNDPKITADNNGHALPSLPIIPVVHSEGSGSTAQYTRWLSKEYPALWQQFSGYSGLTEYWPSKTNQIAQNGSDGVMNFLTSSSADGAIGYDEYSYALGKNYPVAKLQNTAGYYTLPTQYNVAVALTQAKINYNQDPGVCPQLGFSPPCYLLQNLDSVYTYSDPRTYPISSYSYGIIPTGTDAQDSKMTTAKRQTLADFLYYSVCQGQREVGPIGYSPLPINLVEASFQQVALLHQADSNVDLTQENVSNCHNPTFIAGQPSQNYLAQIAPQPAACDNAGSGPCTTGNDTTGPALAGESSAPGAFAGSAASAPAGGTSFGSAGGSAGGPTGGTSGRKGAPVGSAALTHVDAASGQVVGGASVLANAAGDPSGTGVPTTLAAGQGESTSLGLGLLAVLLLAASLAAPPWLAHRWAARDRVGL